MWDEEGINGGGGGRGGTGLESGWDETGAAVQGKRWGRKGAKMGPNLGAARRSVEIYGAARCVDSGLQRGQVANEVETLVASSN